MEALKKEIREEMSSLRINKDHVYSVLLRLADEIDGGVKPSTPAPAKKAEPAPAPAKKAEPAPAPVEEAPKPVKKVVRKTTKKKVESAEPVLK